MSVYDLSNVTITERLGGRYYLVETNAGWYIHTDDYGENVFKSAGLFPFDYDFSIVKIAAELDLPTDAEKGEA